MKKIIMFFFAGVLLLTLAACGNQAGNTASSTPEPSNTENQQDPTLPKEPQSEGSDDGETDTSDSKILIAYFSSAGNIVTDEEPKGNVGHGNTKIVADMIQEQVGGDLFFIETAEKYPANYNDTIDVAMQEQRDNARPDLASHVENMDEYGVIFLGYPNWWGTLPQPVFTFLDEYDFSGKTIIPFCTHEGSGFGRSVADLENALPDSTLLEGFVVRGNGASSAGDDVTQWLSGLDI